MIRFTCRLVAGSMLWIGPAVLLLVWSALLFGDSESALLATSGLFFPLLVCSVWLTASTGHVDDDAHRDLMAAASGSPASLHRERTVASLLMALSVAVPFAVAISVLLPKPGHSLVAVLLAAVAVDATAVLVGVAVGTWLMSPVTRIGGAALTLGLIAVIVIVISPPVSALHRSLDRGDLAPAGWYLAATWVLCLTSTLAASHTANRRSGG